VVARRLPSGGPAASIPGMERRRVCSGAPWEDFGRAHAELFGEHHPATSMLAAGLIGRSI